MQEDAAEAVLRICIPRKVSKLYGNAEDVRRRTCKWPSRIRMVGGEKGKSEVQLGRQAG